MKIIAASTIVLASLIFAAPANAEEVPTTSSSIFDCDADEVEVEAYKANCQPADDIDTFDGEPIVSCEDGTVETSTYNFRTEWVWDSEVYDYVPGDEVETEDVHTRKATASECPPPAPEPVEVAAPAVAKAPVDVAPESAIVTGATLGLAFAS